MKKLYSLFAVAALAFTANAQVVDYVAGDQGFANDSELKTHVMVADVLSFTAATNGASNPPKYFNTGKNFRLYSSNADGNGNSITINSLDQDFKIVDVKIYTDEFGSYAPTSAIMSVDGAAINTKIITGTDKESVYHFANVNASSVTLQNGQTGTSAQIRIVKMVVTYKSITQNVIDFATAKNSMLVKNTKVVDQLVFANEADVKVINMNGQVVKSATVAEGTTMNVSSLTPGMYIVTGSVNGKAVSQKIIKK